MSSSDQLYNPSFAVGSAPRVPTTSLKAFKNLPTEVCTKIDAYVHAAPKVIHIVGTIIRNPTTTPGTSRHTITFQVSASHLAQLHQTTRDMRAITDNRLSEKLVANKDNIFFITNFEELARSLNGNLYRRVKVQGVKHVAISLSTVVNPKGWTYITGFSWHVYSGIREEGKKAVVDRVKLLLEKFESLEQVYLVLDLVTGGGDGGLGEKFKNAMVGIVGGGAVLGLPGDGTVLPVGYRELFNEYGVACKVKGLLREGLGEVEIKSVKWA